MKHLHTFERFLNETKNTYKGDDVLPDWINPKRDFGSVVKNMQELKRGSVYILFDAGISTWQAQQIYQGKNGSLHLFHASLLLGGGNQMEFTDAELADEVKKGTIIKQK